jgi:hypothetical protein
MKIEEVRILLQKYFEAETTLAEEEMLSAWFRTKEIPDEFRPYTGWFTSLEQDENSEEDTFAETAIEKMIRNGEVKKRRLRRILVPVTGIAASLLIFLGATLYQRQRQPFRDTFDDPEIALACAEKTLAFVSAEYNKGLAGLAPVSKLKHASGPLNKSFSIIGKGFAQIDKIKYVNNLNKSEK